MIRNAFFAFLFLSIGVLSAQAQTDVKKGEVYVGFSNGQVDTGVDSGESTLDFFRDRESFNGINVSGVYNLNRYFGVKGDISATFNKTRLRETFSDGLGNDYTVGFDTSNQLYNYVGGIQIKDNAKSGTFKPFAHVMAGGATFKTKIRDFTCVAPAGEDCDDITIGDESFSTTGFSGIVGGGLDIRVSDRFQIRAIQVDYNPTRFEGQWLNNVRIGAGVVF